MHVFVCIRVYMYAGQRLMLDVLVYASFFERPSFPESGTRSSVQRGWLGSHPPAPLSSSAALGLLKHVVYMWELGT